MPINLKYPSLPSFIVNGINYNTCGNIRRPLPDTGQNGLSPNASYESYAPFIEARFRIIRENQANVRPQNNNGYVSYYITTGNFLGTDRDKRAFIKSASMGISQSYGATLEIIDTSGQDFTSFYNSVYRDRCDATPRRGVKNTDIIKVSLNFGYVFTNKNGGNAIYQQSFVDKQSLPGKPIGPYIDFLVTKIDVTFDNNIWKYKLELKGPDAKMGQRRTQNVLGKSSQKIPILTSFELMQDGTCPPKPTNAPKQGSRIALVRQPQGQNGGWSYAKQKNADTNAGRSGVYPGYNLPVLDAIAKNLNNFVTDHTKGVFLCYPSGANDECLYLVEAESTECLIDRTKYRSCKIKQFVGTYVVNGGDLSPVISFSPKIEFVGVPNRFVGAAPGGANSSKSVIIQGCNQNSATNNEPGKETVVAGAATSNNRESSPPAEIGQKTAEAASLHLEAGNFSKPMLGAVTADLTIQGDPRFLWSWNIIGSFIKIIFINPFTVIQSDLFDNGKINGVWLSLPTINDQISSIAFLINGCDHELSDGKWITKLKLTGVEQNNRALKS